MSDLYESDSIPEFDLSLSDIVPAVATETPSTWENEFSWYKYDPSDVVIATWEPPEYQEKRCAVCHGIALSDQLGGWNCEKCGDDVETI